MTWRAQQLALLESIQTKSISTVHPCTVEDTSRFSKKTVNHADSRAKKAPLRHSLQVVDFVEFPSDMKDGTRCTNCEYQSDGICGFHGDINGEAVDLRGLRVYHDTCCAAWDRDGVTRPWDEATGKKSYLPIRTKKNDESGASTGGHWITLSSKDKAGDKHGNVHVFIDDNGAISKGPEGLRGKRISELKQSHSVEEIHGRKHPETGTTEGPKEEKKPKREAGSFSKADLDAMSEQERRQLARELGMDGRLRGDSLYRNLLTRAAEEKPQAEKPVAEKPSNVREHLGNQIEDALKDKYSSLRPEENSEAISVAALRRANPDLSRQEFDDAVMNLWRQGKIGIEGYSDDSVVPREDKEGGIQRDTGTPLTYIYPKQKPEEDESEGPKESSSHVASLQSAIQDGVPKDYAKPSSRATNERQRTRERAQRFINDWTEKASDEDIQAAAKEMDIETADKSSYEVARAVKDKFVADQEERVSKHAATRDAEERERHRARQENERLEREQAGKEAKEREDTKRRAEEWFNSLETEPQRKVSGDISPLEHREAAGKTSEKAKKLFASAHQWEESKPWNLSEQQVKNGKAPGFEYGSYGGRGEETAHYEDGKIVLSPKFFAIKHEDTRKAVIYHELGHELSDTMLADGTAFRLKDAGLMPKELNGQTTPGEQLSEAYSLLHSDPEYLERHAPELIKPLVERAESLGMPVPKGFLKEGNKSRDRSSKSFDGRVVDLQLQFRASGSSGARAEQRGLQHGGLLETIPDATPKESTDSGVRRPHGDAVEKSWRAQQRAILDVHDKAWDESKHPRDDIGRFTDASGGNSDSPTTPANRPRPDAATNPFPPPAGKPQSTAEPQKPSSSADRSPLHKSLETAPMKRGDHLIGGESEKFLLTLEDGTKGVFKPASGEGRQSRIGIPSGGNHIREVAASRVADVLGVNDLVPVTTFREQKGHGIGSMQGFVGGAEQPFESKQPFDGEEDARRAAAYDYLVGNLDRHWGNWGLKDGKLVLWDNGLSFPESYHEHDMFNMAFWQNAYEKNLKFPDLSAWEDRWEVLEHELKQTGLSEQAIQLTKQRFDALTSGKYKRISELPSLVDEGESLGDMVFKYSVDGRQGRLQRVRTPYPWEEKSWDESKHPREPAGSSHGGEWTSDATGSTSKQTQLKISDEVRNSHSGQVEATLTARTSDGKIAAHLDYSVFEKKPHIDMVESHQKGIGAGAELVRHLASEYGYENIEWGMMTPDGIKLRDKLDKEYGVERVTEKVNVESLVSEAGGKLLSEESGSRVGMTNIYVEFDSEEAGDRFLRKLEGMGAENVDMQQAGGRAWVQGDIELVRHVIRKRE